MTAAQDMIAAEDIPDGLVTVVDETTVRAEVAAWRARVLKRPGLWDKATRGTQDRINRIIPERVHQVITAGIEAMTKGILFGSDVLQARPGPRGTLAASELKARAAIKVYRNTESAGWLTWAASAARLNEACSASSFRYWSCRRVGSMRAT